MENSLPVKLKNVHYYLVSGIFSSEYNWAGDLIITRDVIFYFPVRDSIKERKAREKALPLGGLVGFAVHELAEYLNRNKSYFDNLYAGDETDEQLRERLDSFFLRKKEDEGAEIFSYSTNIEGNSLLPPVRFEAKDVQDITLKRGKLQFNTAADCHDFKFSNKETEQIRNGLESSQFLFR